MINKVVFDNLSDFELVHIFECGQCFRWRREDDGSYTGVIKQGVLNVNNVDGKVIVCEILMILRPFVLNILI